MTAQIDSLALRMAKLWVVCEIDRDAARQIDKIADDLLEAESSATALAPYQQRVVDEKAELDVNIAALAKFIDPFPSPNTIFAGLPESERMRLYAQHRVMVEYSTILGERIAAF